MASSPEPGTASPKATGKAGGGRCQKPRPARDPSTSCASALADSEARKRSAYGSCFEVEEREEQQAVTTASTGEVGHHGSSSSSSSTAPAEAAPSPGRGARWDVVAGVRGTRSLGEGRDAAPEQAPRVMQYLLEAMEEAKKAQTKCTEEDLQLWIAARDGRSDDVRAALEAGARVDVELPEDHPLTLVYKNRQVVCCQPVHAAACFRGGGQCPQGGWGEAEEVVRLLLEARANAKASARVRTDIFRRELQAIHLAAGVGNAGTIRLLVQRSADPDAAAISDNKVHYLPIHDAVWFNRLNSVSALIEVHASIGGANISGETALHLAAKLGYASLVGMLLSRWDCRELVRLKDKAGSTAFDLAVENGQFPPHDLGLFTLHLDQEERVRAFIQVARACPAAAAALLRSRDMSNSRGGAGGAQLDEEWRSSLQAAARNGKITVHDFASLIAHAPQAAMDLMDALTEVPEVKDQQHHPLPVRARLAPAHPCAVSSAYELDEVWQWTPLRTEHQGGQPWHHDFAPPDARRGLEVSVRVLRLRGAIDAQVLSSLAETADLRLFTKLVVHALLLHSWRNLKWIFITGFIHEILASLVLSFWIWWSFEPPGDFWRRLLWCCIASQGIVDSTLIILATWRCWRILGRERLLLWLSHIWFRLMVDGFTTVLVHFTRHQHWPSSEGREGMLMAVNSLLHGVHLLYQLRAFQWTGQRLLPIMKSVQPIAGMLVIMLFLIVSFVNAFWAMDRRATGRDVRVFEVVVFLLTGEGFLDSDDLVDAELGQRYLYILLTVFASFFFIACALNVFIAVLGDCYDQEQERMVCTFLKERARICGMLFLWPSWDAPRAPEPGDRKEPEAVPASARCARSQDLGLGAAVVLLTAGSFVGLRPSSFESAWPAAILLSVGLLLAQVQLRHKLTLGWGDRYLWLCHDRHVEEDMFLAPDGSSGGAVETHGRLAVIKRYIFDQSRAAAEQSRAEVSTLQQGLDGCQEELSALRSEVRDLAWALRRVVGDLPSGLVPQDETHHNVPPAERASRSEPRDPGHDRGAPRGSLR